MACNLRKKIPASSTLYVLDLDQDIIQRLVTKYGSYGNIEIAHSEKDLANKVGSGIILSSLPAGPHVRKVWYVPLDACR